MSGSQRHRHFAGFFNVPVLHRHGTYLFIRRFRHTVPLFAFYDTLGIRRTHSRLKPPASSRGDQERKICNMEIKTVKLVVKGRAKLTVPLVWQEEIQVESKRDKSDRDFSKSRLLMDNTLSMNQDVKLNWDAVSELYEFSYVYLYIST